jgi:hypothetical protein
LAAALDDRPALAPKDLADQPLELLAIEKPQVARPLEEMPTITRLDLDEEPAEEEGPGKDGAPEIRDGNPQRRPPEG